MLGEAISMLVPQVVGFRLHGQLPEGATATDLVLTVTQILRATGVVGKFVEYFGEGLAGLPLADRATIGNMSPEYGATCGFFPVDDETLRYLRLTGRDEARVALVEAYCKENLLWHDPSEPATYSQVVELDLSTVEPSLAGPRRPQDRIALAAAKARSSRRCRPSAWTTGTRVDEAVAESFPASDPPAHSGPGAEEPHGRAGGRPAPVAVVPARTGHRVRARRRDRPPRPRRGRDRRDHVVHEHLEPLGDGRRGAAREEGRRARPRPAPVGEVEPRAGVEGRQRLLRARRPDAVPRGARLPHRRLRLHDVHRELRAAARAGLRRRSPRATSSPARCSPGTGTSRRASTPR